MINISDVFKIKTESSVEYRNKKWCVCVSVTEDNYLLINTHHRDMYEDFEIKAADYEFLNSVDRFVCCSKLWHFDSTEIETKVGNLSRDDMLKLIDTVQKSKKLSGGEKKLIVTNVKKWLLE